MLLHVTVECKYLIASTLYSSSLFSRFYEHRSTEEAQYAVSEGESLFCRVLYTTRNCEINKMNLSCVKALWFWRCLLLQYHAVCPEVDWKFLLVTSKRKWHTKPWPWQCGLVSFGKIRHLKDKWDFQFGPSHEHTSIIHLPIHIQ